MKTIIAATNLMEESNHAVEFAADVAKQLKAKLIIFNDLVFEPVISEYPMPMDVYDVTIEQTQKSLSDLEAKIKARTGNEIQVKKLGEIGSIRSEFDKLFAREKPFLVFISSQSIGAVERVIFGTRGFSIVKHSSFPIIVVPPMANMTGFKKIALAIDLEHSGKIPWSFLRYWLAIFNPQTDIVYVSKVPNRSPNELSTAIDVEQQLGGFHPKYHFITNDSVKDGLYEYIEVNKPDLLIMFVQKHSFFHKSETKPFVIHPPVPTMMLTSKINDNIINEEEKATHA